MAEVKKHTGGCHCGRVRFEVNLALGTAMECNCSICTKKAHLLTFVPVEQFKLLSGEDDLADYQFNKHVIHHLFCKTCGVQSFARGVGPNGAEMAAVNVRCLDDFDPSTIELQKYDGRSK